jgi:glycosyltransferase involved in cell wall biosynthesis
VTRRSRVLLLAASADLYGSDRVLLDVIDALQPDREIVVVLPATGPLVVELGGRGIPIVVLDDYVLRKRNLRPAAAAAWFARLVRSARSIGRMHRQAPFTVVYSNTLAVPLGVWLKLRFRVKHLWHAHEVLDGAAWFRRAMGLAVRRGSDTVVCVSRSVEDALVAVDPAIAAQSVVVYNAVDVPEVTRSRVPHLPIVIGCVGRLYPRKGHLLLLDALARVRASGTECALVVFGDPLPGTTYLDDVHEAIERHRLHDVVTLRGFVPHNEDIYSEFDVLVLPSTEPEAFPLACLEAQAWGLPVIAPAEGGPSEIVAHGETGILARPRDVAEFAEAIKALATSPELCSRMGRAGRQRMARCFGRDTFCDRIRGIVAGSSETRRAVSRRAG